MYFPHTLPGEEGGTVPTHHADDPADDVPGMELEPLTSETREVALEDLPDKIERPKTMRRSSSLGEIASMIDFQNFNQEQMTKKDVRLCVCVYLKSAARPSRTPSLKSSPWIAPPPKPQIVGARTPVQLWDRVESFVFDLGDSPGTDVDAAIQR